MWFVVLAGLLACAGNAADVPCPVVMKPPAVVVEYNANFSADCMSLTNKTEGMGWESSAGGTDLIEDATNVSLHIKSVTDWRLSPKCYVNLLDGSQCSSTLPVTVYKIMESVSLSTREAGYPNLLVEGKTYLMHCAIVYVAPVRNLTVYWYKGTKLLKTETFNESNPDPVIMTTTMNVTVDRSDNGARISCEAKLSFPQQGLNLPSQKAFSPILTVQYPATFPKPGNETVEVPAQSKLSLDCTAAGKPLPEYSWVYLPPSQQTGQDQNVSGPILASSFHLPGTYRCTASNIHGLTTKYFTVTHPAANQTTLVAIVAVVALLGVALLVAGPFIVTPSGTFSLSTGSYTPAASGPV